MVQADGFGRSLFRFDHAMAVDGVIELGEIVLPPGQRIEGLVTSRSGVPVPRAFVRLDGHNGDIDRFVHGGAVPTSEDDYGIQEVVASDDLGRFRFDDLAPGDYSVSCAPAAPAPVPAQPREPPLLPLFIALRAAAIKLSARTLNSDSGY